ncbi:xanthine dehydrogenase family protein molybdopterin-binding subunit [Fictibacillus terranigra]|uniref:Xanthine dehydrogenase family protein molybdopterin-binding subunit n=1 Tax=Fictibacillus terranigra TaxID=3058424 RepID=A0ABT8E2Y0_9BACL|nr:xanthine dehydrogenase family protein molybdopterin-binding subunit [Fictibacillus sp. CENA-BCM004]MDN4072278.1 xanthine dehydrogenase family protein molybdopterin-binding subunit [Fictibacillus sp. CENA-BCM004]
MNPYRVIGKSVPKKESWDKVSGRVKYVDDNQEVGTLHVKLLTSHYAHAYIKKVDTEEARKVQGVHAIVTGKDYPLLIGTTIKDRPLLAFDKVRYYGEPIAMVIADTEAIAIQAVTLIHVNYELLPVVNSSLQAYQKGAPLVHERLEEYLIDQENETTGTSGGIRPIPGTNIANRQGIRKGNTDEGFAQSDFIVEEVFSFPQSDHTAIETRCSDVEIKKNGDVIIHSASQEPFEMRELISETFNIDQGKVHVHIPLVGGSFGAKTSVQLEPLAYVASKSVGGRRVRLRNSREEDIVTSAVHIGLHAKIKMGCTKDGKLQAVKFLFLFDGGAYAERAVPISKAAAFDCTGPYAIDNVWCDSLCMYTNHPYATDFRGFGRTEAAFGVERTMDILAHKVGLCPLEFRLINAIQPGDTSPTQVLLNRSNLGDIKECILKLKELIDWDQGQRIKISDRKVRAKGISCAWKNGDPPPGVGAGAVLTFTSEGGVLINSAAVEIGQGTKTVLTQMVAEKMRMSVHDVNIQMEVNTQLNPESWETAASRTTFLSGNAVLRAVADAVNQLKRTASVVLNVPAEELVVANKKVFKKTAPQISIDFSEIVYGYIFPDGTVAGTQVIGRGSYIIPGLTEMNPETGKGVQGPEWNVVAQAVEVEFDKRDNTFTLIRAITVADAGTVLNYKGAETQVMGAMNQGLSFATREGFIYDDEGKVLTTQFRSYKVMHYGEQPEYIVRFIENPVKGSPFGSRGLGEHGIMGMPAAVANSLSIAAKVPLNQLPLTPEFIWKTRLQRGGGSNASL